MANNPNLANEGLNILTGISEVALFEIGSAVKRTATEDGFEPCDTVGEKVDGIVWTKPEVLGDVFAYIPTVGGQITGKARAGAAIGSVGADITTDAGGLLIVTTTSTHNIVGRSRTTTGAANLSFRLEIEDGDRLVP